MGTPIPKTPEEQRANLARLADYLDALPEDYQGFSMAVYYHSDPECGTIACALGHGPIAGIGPTARTVSDQLGWHAYEGMYFGIYSERDHLFLFSGAWEGRDKTPKGAARRIRHFLEHGTPPGDLAYEWIRGAPYA